MCISSGLQPVMFRQGMVMTQPIYKKTHEIIDRTVAGETILVPLRGKLVDMQKIFALNPVGDFIWQRLDGQQTAADICRQACAVFDGDQKTIENDVNAFLGDLIAAELIVAVT